MHLPLYRAKRKGCRRRHREEMAPENAGGSTLDQVRDGCVNARLRL